MAQFSTSCTIIIPIHLLDNYWVLGVANIDMHPELGIHILVYDSMSMVEENEKVLQNLKKYILDLYFSKFGSNIGHCIEMRQEGSVQQTNGWDCGIFTIANAISVCLDKNPLLYGFSAMENM